MLILEKLENYNRYGVILFDKIKNNIVEGYFIKINYSNECVVMNSLYLQIPLNYSSDFFKIRFSAAKNGDVIASLIEIERDILSRVAEIAGETTTPIYKLRDQLLTEEIRFFNLAGSVLYLKISGIWITKKEYGLSFKFMK